MRGRCSSCAGAGPSGSVACSPAASRPSPGFSSDRGVNCLEAVATRRTRARVGSTARAVPVRNSDDPPSRPPGTDSAGPRRRVLLPRDRRAPEPRSRLHLRRHTYDERLPPALAARAGALRVGVRIRRRRSARRPDIRSAVLPGRGAAVRSTRVEHRRARTCPAGWCCRDSVRTEPMGRRDGRTGRPACARTARHSAGRRGRVSESPYGRCRRGRIGTLGARPSRFRTAAAGPCDCRRAEVALAPSSRLVDRRVRGAGGACNVVVAAELGSPPLDERNGEERDARAPLRRRVWWSADGGVRRLSRRRHAPLRQRARCLVSARTPIHARNRTRTLRRRSIVRSRCPRLRARWMGRRGAQAAP